MTDSELRMMTWELKNEWGSPRSSAPGDFLFSESPTGRFIYRSHPDSCVQPRFHPGGSQNIALVLSTRDSSDGICWNYVLFSSGAPAFGWIMDIYSVIRP